MGRLLRLLPFRVGADTFAVDIMAVRQIVKPDSDRIRSSNVVDLRRRYVLRRNDYPDLPLVLLLGAADGTVGVRIDEVLEPIDVDADHLQLPDTVVGSLRGDDVVAVIPWHEDDAIAILDVDGLHSSERPSGASAR